MKAHTATLLICFVCTAGVASLQAQTLEGSWKFMKEESTDLATWRYRLPQITITKEENRVRLIHDWLERNQVALADTFIFFSGGDPSTIEVASPIWPENWYMGVLAKTGTTKTVSGTWLEEGRALWMSIDQTVETSQGDAVIHTTREYRLDRESGLLTLTERRMTRPTPVLLVFERIVNPGK
jgi:hypothetical protein